jgi:hypothetical protein
MSPLVEETVHARLSEGEDLGIHEGGAFGERRAQHLRFLVEGLALWLAGVLRLELTGVDRKPRCALLQLVVEIQALLEARRRLSQMSAAGSELGELRPGLCEVFVPGVSGRVQIRQVPAVLPALCRKSGDGKGQRKTSGGDWPEHGRQDYDSSNVPRTSTSIGLVSTDLFPFGRRSSPILRGGRRSSRYRLRTR